jgi:hypothetical protein
MGKTIIGFAGRKRSGKTSLSVYLAKKHEGTVVTVADALKNLCCDLLGFETIEELNTYKDKGTSWSFNPARATQWAKTICEKLFGEYTDKQYDEILSELDGLYTFNVRELLQFIGTDIIRKYKPNWHVDKMVEAINNATTDLVCIDDVRFQNEKAAIEKLRGIVFFIMRPDLSISVSNHESEISLTWTEFSNECRILNMFDLEYMCEKMDEAYSNGFCNIKSNLIFGSSNNFNGENKYFAFIGKNKPYRPNYLDYSDAVRNYNFVKHVVLGNVKKHDGCIVLHPKDKETMQYYRHELYTSMLNDDKIKPIVLWNPYIIENLKAWL